MGKNIHAIIKRHSVVDKYLQRTKFLMTEGGISQKLLFDGMMERLAE